MKQQIAYALLVASVSALPTVSRSQIKREVPAEHSHENVVRVVNTALQINNPDNIQDAVFGLLGAKAAAEGAGNIQDADCLQQATADQAFTNAKAAGDVNGQTFALIYRALERNSGSVGLASPLCTSIQAVNPEIAALQQHQDPAGNGAQAANKKLAATLAQQIASVGGDPTLANEASTFAPGQTNDPTGKGNTCDDANDAKGCINSLNLRVDDLSAAEIQAAVAGVSAGGAAGNSSAAAAAGGAASGAASSAASGAASGCAGAANAASGNAAAQQAAGKGSANTASASSAAQQAAATNAANAGAANAGASGAANAGGANSSAGGAASASGADFGTCNNVDINFGIPSDGRNEDAFEAADLTNFAHGSALNIKVISDFICTQLVNKCGANQAAVTQCDAAEAAANGKTGQAAADAFNNAINA